MRKNVNQGRYTISTEKDIFTSLCLQVVALRYCDEEAASRII